MSLKIYNYQINSQSMFLIRSSVHQKYSKQKPQDSSDKPSNATKLITFSTVATILTASTRQQKRNEYG